jgi:hypothetical protein
MSSHRQSWWPLPFTAMTCFGERDHERCDLPPVRPGTPGGAAIAEVPAQRLLLGAGAAFTAPWAVEAYAAASVEAPPLALPLPAWRKTFTFTRPSASALPRRAWSC